MDQPNDCLTRIDGATALSLENGGNISIVDTNDGEFFLVVDMGVHVSVPVSRVDVQNLRHLAGDMILRSAA